LPTTLNASEAVLEAADMLIGVGASQVSSLAHWSGENCGRIPTSIWQYRVCRLRSIFPRSEEPPTSSDGPLISWIWTTTLRWFGTFW
jgi:hypothetical protein